jgi:prolyl oligopeptidase
MKYPKVKREDFYEEYHNKQKVQDPYRWMEKTEENEELKNWIEEENKITEDFINNCSEREKIEEELKKVMNYEKVGNPFKRGNKYYFYKNDGLQNFYVN